jgi:BirA family transcriptional regulator, biotin operon repressor / biotin---[acetyl-CoA-carboxylase] ligase
MVAFGNVKLFYDSLPSTNLKLAELLATEYIENGMAVYTAFQSRGKGQQSNVWSSEEGKNLLVSFGLRHTSLPVEKLFFLNAFVSLALVDLLQDYFTERVFVKWPNDIYVSNSKIAGILIENVLAGHSIKSSIIGIGLNINQRIFPEDLSNPTSMSILTGREFSIPDILDRLSELLSINYQLLIAEMEQQLWEKYNTHLYGKNEVKAFAHIQGGVFDATILQVTPNGRMLLDCGGEPKSFNFGEIKMLIDDEWIAII